MNISLLSFSFCSYCAQPTSDCICPKTRSQGGSVTSIAQKALKKGKYVTLVSGNLNPEDFKKIKQMLGTGGSLTGQLTTFRGKVSKRVKNILGGLGYRLPST